MSSATIPDLPRRGGGNRCPVCGNPPLAAATPFCGQGCRDRDLLRWLSEGHRIPGPPADDDDPADPRDDGLDS